LNADNAAKRERKKRRGGRRRAGDEREALPVAAGSRVVATETESFPLVFGA
jgi:hypothetical protein